VDTLVKSAGNIPEVFLRGCGLSDEFIAYIPSLVATSAIDFYSCFISYSHDNDQHAQNVLKLANDLRRTGFTVLIDQQIAAPSEGWPLWMNKGMKNADYVLVICTKTYLRRLMQEEDEGLGFGCRFEGKIIYNIIYNQASLNNKFLPVLFDKADEQYIPDLISGDTSYQLDTKGFDLLKRRLQDKHQAFTPPVATLENITAYKDPGSLNDVTTTVTTQIDLPSTPSDIVGREKEIEQLNQAWADDNTRVISFIAWGGVGKSSLINHWLTHMCDHGFKGAERVFAHSFYSQGTSDQRHVSAEHFLNQAFKFLKYKDERPPSPHDQGLLLAELFSQRKTLLILDGLEPMQYPPGDLEGRLKDQSLAALLKNLAYNLNGLCVITSRVPVFELRATKSPSYELEQLSVEAGIQVLENNQVTGPKAEMVKAVKEVEGHALTLALLGSYLKTVYSGDIGKRDQMTALAGRHKQGKHAKKVMQSYHVWLETKNGPELDILYILGLFDRAADKEAIDVLKTAPAIEGVSDRLQNLSHEDWAFAVESLVELRLILKPDDSQMLDCHPLVREYFTAQLKTQNPVGYQAAHSRLYDYYKNLPDKKLPDTLEELAPLFTAVAHGCLAGLHQQALDEVYRPRIQRRDEDYMVHRLGAYGTDLACVACFFDKTWDIPSECLTGAWQAEALNWAGFRLRGLGRLLEAAEPFVASIEMFKEQENWGGVAENACNTSELYLALGNLSQAAEFGEQSVTYADRSEDDTEKFVNRTTWADALFQSGEQQKAHALFIDAEAIQQKLQPQYDMLYSVQGFQFCAL
ncbi:MAG: toll/interleukin-1 receptor domain-containing protein, partial [Psychrosphaera sp.]|nr:toll/interleukin-1 receptor domain-containing protein [Psychrosphaera sp.]